MGCAHSQYELNSSSACLGNGVVGCEICLPHVINSHWGSAGPDFHVSIPSPKGANEKSLVTGSYVCVQSKLASPNWGLDETWWATPMYVSGNFFQWAFFRTSPLACTITGAWIQGYCAEGPRRPWLLQERKGQRPKEGGKSIFCMGIWTSSFLSFALFFLFIRNLHLKLFKILLCFEVF